MEKVMENARRAALRGESDLGAPSRMRAEPANLCLLLTRRQGVVTDRGA